MGPVLSGPGREHQFFAGGIVANDPRGTRQFLVDREQRMIHEEQGSFWWTGSNETLDLENSAWIWRT